MNRSLRSGFNLLICIALALAVAGAAYARAGGGQSYGSDGGGGGGGGEGLGIIFYLIMQLVVRYPLVGIPLLIVAIIVAAKMGKVSRTTVQYRTIEKAGRLTSRREQDDLAARLGALSARDPGFSPERFVERVNAAFTEIQQAWSDQDMSAVRRFVSDGVSERFGLQIDMQKADGIRNRMEDLVIQSTRLVGAESDRMFDTIHVEITARARDTDVDASSGRVLRVNSTEPFTEYWSFLRRPGATTLSKGGLIEGLCPNCGAGLEISDAGKCTSCDSIVTSGEYDWVLAEITQSMEWGTVSNPAIIPGFEEMSAKDPAFNLQHVEDRTSVIFWRYIRAYFDGTADAVRKLSSPLFTAELMESQARSREGGWWLCFRDAAVGAVEVQRITPAPGEGQDRIEVLVRWSARNAQRMKTGQVRSAGDRMIRPMIFTLVRNSGVRTQAVLSFLSTHCQGCGAPYEGGDTGSCDYCGRPLNDGSQDWILSSIERFDPARFAARTVEPLSRASLVPPDLLLASMASAMSADGVIDPSERELLGGFARSHGVSDQALEEIVAAVEGGGDLPAPENPDQAREVLGAMVRMVIADGRISKEELDLLVRFGASAGLARADVMMILARQRSQLYSQAKQTIRQG